MSTFHAYLDEQAPELRVIVGFAKSRDSEDAIGVDMSVDELAAMVQGLTDLLAGAREVEASRARRPALRSVK